MLPGQFQHIPLDRYRENLKKIVNHASLTPHAPKLVLITPAPICEYMAESCDAVKGRFVMQRTAEVTKTYGDACAEVGKELGLPVVNLWEAFVDYAGGWKEGEPLPGSRKCPQNEKLDSLFRDGLHFSPQGYVPVLHLGLDPAAHTHFDIF